MKSSTFWDISLCSPLKVIWHIGGTCRLHLQGWRISQAGNQDEEGSKQNLAGFMLGLFFCPADGHDMFLRNVCWLSTGYTALYPRRQKSSIGYKVNKINKWQYLLYFYSHRGMFRSINHRLNKCMVIEPQSKMDPDLTICDDGLLIQLLCFWTLSIVLSGDRD
jgi:hypothetical protein